MDKALKTKDKRERGAILIVTSIGLVVFLAFAALAIDLTYISACQKELQAIADASALAGVVELIDGDVTGAISEAVSSANNQAKYKLLPYLTVTSSSVEPGTFDEETMTFTPTMNNPNSLRVTLSRQAATGNGIPTFFARIVGVQQVDISAQAVATTGRRDFVLVIDNSGSINDVTEYTQAVSGAPLPNKYAVNSDLTTLASELGVNKYKLRNFFCRKVFYSYWGGCKPWTSTGSANRLATKRTNVLNITAGGDGEGEGIQELADRLGDSLTVPSSDISDAASFLGLPQDHADVQRLARLVATERLLATGQCTEPNCEEQPISVIEDAAKTFIDMLDDRVDRVALVRFAGFNDPDHGGQDPDPDAEGHLISGLTNDFEGLKTLVESIHGNADVSIDGTTDIRSGIERALEELDANSPDFALKVIILLTDGRANQPWSNPQQAALDQAQLAVDNGVMIYTVGVGEYLDSDLLVQIADLSGGDSNFTTDPLGLSTAPDAEPGMTNLDYIFSMIAKRIPYRLTM